MKIRFDNHSVSGIDRKYQGFVLDIPGQSSQVVDVPPQYVSDVLSYLSRRHPAVVCNPVVEKAETPQTPQTVVVLGNSVKDALPDNGGDKVAVLSPVVPTAVVKKSKKSRR